MTQNEVTQAAHFARPDLYAKERLGLNLHPKQAAVLRDWVGRKGSRVSLRKSNEVGGTTSIIAPGILFALEILKAQVISTAGVWMQVKDQLMSALKSHQSKFPDWRFLESEISIGGISRYVGFSTRDEGFAQGFHKRQGMPLVAAIDEAAAVGPGVFNGVEERCNPDCLLVSGSPLDPVGNFYDIETKHAALYTHHHMNQMDCLTTDGYWIDPASIERKIQKWGRDHPLVQSNVFGQFSNLVEGALLSLSEFERAAANQLVQEGSDIHAGLDFGAGRAKNVVALTVGNHTSIVKKWIDRDTMSACGEFVAVLNDLRRRFGLRPEDCDGDADGLGIVMIGRLAEMGWPIGKFHGGAKPRFSQDYQDEISEAWGEGAAKMKRLTHQFPNDPDFKAQVLTRKLKRASDGKFKLESKEDMAKRGVESPDEADAVFISAMPSKLRRSVNVMGERRQVDDAKSNLWEKQTWEKERGPREGEYVPGAWAG